MRGQSVAVDAAMICCLLLSASGAFCEETSEPLVHSGRSAVRVVNDCDKWKPGMDVGLDCYNSLIKVSAGHKLRISFWMRYDGQTSGVLAKMSIPTFSVTGHLKDMDLMVAAQIPARWTHYSFDYVVPVAGNRINVAFRPHFARDNALVIDDVSVLDTTTSPGLELCPNGGFENWPDESRPPVSWRFFRTQSDLGKLEYVGTAAEIDADYTPH